MFLLKKKFKRNKNVVNLNKIVGGQRRNLGNRKFGEEQIFNVETQQVLEK